MQFWYDYGKSASEEDFFFIWDPKRLEYRVEGWRAGEDYNLSFTPIEGGVHIKVTSPEKNGTWDWLTGEKSTTWVNADYKLDNSSADWDRVRAFYSAEEETEPDDYDLHEEIDEDEDFPEDSGDHDEMSSSDDDYVPGLSVVHSPNIEGTWRVDVEETNKHNDVPFEEQNAEFYYDPLWGPDACYIKLGYTVSDNNNVDFAFFDFGGEGTFTQDDDKKSGVFHLYVEAAGEDYDISYKIKEINGKTYLVADSIYWTR